MKNKYGVGDKIKTRIHYRNDSRTEVDAVIIDIMPEKDKVDYKIEFDGTPMEKLMDASGAKAILTKMTLLAESRLGEINHE